MRRIKALGAQFSIPPHSVPMPDLLAEIVRRTDVNQPMAVCTLARTHGSTPQKAGAMMLVLPDGQTLGTLGGGCVEAEVRSKALQALAAAAYVPTSNFPLPTCDATRPPTLLRFTLDQDYGWDDGLVCGGVMFVTVQTLRTRHDAAPWREAQYQLNQGRTAVTPLHVIDEAGQPHTLTHEQIPAPALLIAGAGHVGQALAQLTAMLGFRVTVLDDRPDAASVDRFPDATCLVGPVESTLAAVPFTDHTSLVIVTRGHRHDGQTLAAALRHRNFDRLRYLGLIGSRRKILSIYKALLDEGIDPASLHRVHAPVGLNLGAVTPHEIALSIAAELTAVRRDVPLNDTGPMRLDPDALTRLGGGRLAT